VVEAHPTDWAEPGRLVSNGPFILESWERGQRLVLTRNPAYAGRFTGNVQRAELYFDQSDMLALYEADQRDIALHIHFKWSPPEREHALQRYVGEYMLSPALWVSYLGFDVSQPPFHDARVRRALAMAADREKLVSVALHGEVFPATGGLTPPNMFGHSPGIALPYDPDRARRSLAEAGYPGGQGFPAVFTWIPTTPAFRLFREMFRYLQAQWREQLGLEITVEPMEGAEAGAYYDQLREAPPSLFLAPWLLDYPDPDNILRLGSFRSYTRWRNETYDRLLEEARRTMDADARLQKYQQADRLLVEEAAVVPLSYQWHHALVKPWVKRFFVTPTTMYFLRDVILEPH